ncbi:MAG TPA: Ig domain-containing protein [Longimicrobium sp.]|jgi:hypothetical protein
MPDIRVVAWNIKFFTGSVYTTHRNIILEQLYDSANARLCDVFVIVEPKVGTKPQRVGEFIDRGAGAKGVMELYYALYAKDAAWRVVPPRASCAGTKADFVAVLYHSGLLALEGPEHDHAIPQPTGVKGGGVPDPWGPPGTTAGQIRFYHRNGNEVGFHGRRPYLVRFRDAAQTAATARRTFTLTVHAAAPVAAPGALSITTPQALPPGAPGEYYEVQLQAANVTGAATWSLSGGTLLPTGLALSAAGELWGVPDQTAVGTTSFTVQVADSTGTQTKALDLDVDAALAIATAATLPDAVEDEEYEVRLGACGGHPPRYWSVATGSTLPDGLELDEDGLLHGTPTAAGSPTFDLEVKDSGPGFYLVGLHAPPQGGKGYPANANVTAIQAIADIRELTTERGATPAAICGDYNVCPLACCSATNAPAFTTMNTRFTHQNFNEKTSLKNWKKNAGQDNALTADYRSHYFDHVYCAGFAQVKDVKVLNLVTMHAKWNDWNTNGTVKSFNAIWNAVAWKKGVSDHLPVAFTVVI